MGVHPGRVPGSDAQVLLHLIRRDEAPIEIPAILRLLLTLGQDSDNLDVPDSISKFIDNIEEVWLSKLSPLSTDRLESNELLISRKTYVTTISNCRRILIL